VWKSTYSHWSHDAARVRASYEANPQSPEPEDQIHGTEVAKDLRLTRRACSGRLCSFTLTRF
jgi:hypothetical protein